MKYTQPSFSVTNSGYTYARGACREVGHMATDAKGKCLRCGELVQPTKAIDCSDFSKPEDWG